MRKIKVIIIVAICVFAASLFMMFYTQNETNRSTNNSANSSESGVVAGVNSDSSVNYVDDLAKALKGQGAVLYCSKDVPDCKDQLKLFDKSAEYLDYVECDSTQADANADECVANQIDIYPTWVFAGNKYNGTQKLADLAKMINFNQK